jgi:hypothetical protein
MSGDPHVRFGGKGHRTQSMLPTPIVTAEHKLTTLAKTEEALPPQSSEALNIAQRNAINSSRMWLNSRRRLIRG